MKIKICSLSELYSSLMSYWCYLLWNFGASTHSHQFQVIAVHHVLHHFLHFMAGLLILAEELLSLFFLGSLWQSICSL